mgnify:CR=1 FL=1
MYRPAHIVLFHGQELEATGIATYLSEHGFLVTLVSSEMRLDRALAERGADLVIADASQPGFDPLGLVTRLSRKDGLGILMLARGDCLDRICCLEAGADDCLPQPAEAREILARSKAVLRRLSKSRPGVGEAAVAEGIYFGSCRLDLINRKLRATTGGEIGITDMEFCLLKTFAEHPNRALNRDELAELAYGRTWSPFDRSLDIRISRLRRKIERDPARPEVILTVRGIGYRYEAKA